MKEEVFHVDFQAGKREVVTVHSEEEAIGLVLARFPEAYFGEWQEQEGGGRFMATKPAWAHGTDMLVDDIQQRVVAFIVDETRDDDED